MVQALRSQGLSGTLAGRQVLLASTDAADLGIPEGMVEEAYLFQQLLRTEDAPVNMRKFLELGGQTREGELKVGELNAQLRTD